MSSSDMKLTQGAAYRDWLASVKSRIHEARMNIALSANSELIALYYELGARITERESTAQWGSGFIDAFSKDLRTSFPEVGGFSAKNLRYCRAFFHFYCSPIIWQQAVAKLASDPWAGVEAELARQLVQIPWGHHIQIFSKCSELAEAGFYIGQTIEQGWSRDVLALQLKSRLYDRAGKLTPPTRTIWRRPASASAPLRARRSRALKEIDKITKMIAEMEEYEREVLYPLATEQVEIDLDDGVKVNYPKFGKALKKIPGLEVKED